MTQLVYFTQRLELAKEDTPALAAALYAEEIGLSPEDTLGIITHQSGDTITAIELVYRDSPLYARGREGREARTRNPQAGLIPSVTDQLTIETLELSTDE